MTDKQNLSTGTITAWIGVVSSVITIVLTVFNTYTKVYIDAADQQLKEREQELEAKFKERTAIIEESKEKTNHYNPLWSL
jgi:hypothetical protein